MRDGDDLVTVLDVPAPVAALGATLSVADARRPAVDVESRAGTQPGETITLRGKGMPRPAAPGPPRATCAWSSTSSSRASCHASSARSLEQLAATLHEDNLRQDEGLVSQAQAGCCRCDPARHPRRDAPTRSSCSPSCSSSRRGGVEERELGPDVVEYARLRRRRASCPSCPRCRPRRAPRSSRSSRSEVADDWADRWRAFHLPGRDRPGACSSARRGRRRREDPAISTSSSIPPRRSAPARTRRRALPRAAARPRAGAARSWTSAAARASSPSPRPGSGGRPSSGVDYEPDVGDRDASRTPRVNGVAGDRPALRPAARRPGADARRPWPPTCCGRCCWRWPGPGSTARRRSTSSPADCCAPRPTRSRRRSPRARTARARAAGGG